MKAIQTIEKNFTSDAKQNSISTILISVSDIDQDDLNLFPQIQLPVDQFWSWVDGEISLINKQIKVK